MTVAAARELQKRRSGSTWNRSGKYNARKVELDGIRFDSKREAFRYAELKRLATAGAILELRLQTRWPITVGGVLVCHYVSDFDYITPAGEVVIEDAKGMRLPIYLLKKKLVHAIYGIVITEI